METKHDQALRLAEELLGDIELNRITPIDVARKSLRLARLTDDSKAMLWLYYEVSGYPEGVGGLDALAWAAAQRSSRVYTKNGKQYARTTGVGQLHASIESAALQLAAAADAPLQIASANPNQYVHANTGNFLERKNLRDEMVTNRGILDKIVGSMHMYVSTKYQELRFGAAVETAFESIRHTVDVRIGALVPAALPILTTALENAADTNPVQWSNAAKACRDLIKAAADALRPPGGPKNGRAMTDDKFLNRLVDWIEENSTSSTMASLVTSDLNDLGNRLDAVTDGGHKGAHTMSVTKEEASRYIVGTYMLLGDILSLSDNSAGEKAVNTPIDQEQADAAKSVAQPREEVEQIQPTPTPVPLLEPTESQAVPTPKPTKPIKLAPAPARKSSRPKNK